MKVLIVSNVYYPNMVGGAEKAAQYLAEGLWLGTTRQCRNTKSTEAIRGCHGQWCPSLLLAREELLLPSAHNGRSSATKGLWHAMDTYNPSWALPWDAFWTSNIRTS